MALPSVRAAGDDPYDGMPVDPDYHYATPPADLCARAGMKYIINTTKHKPKERILERQGEVWLLRGWKSLMLASAPTEIGNIAAQPARLALTCVADEGTRLRIWSISAELLLICPAS